MIETTTTSYGVYASTIGEPELLLFEETSTVTRDEDGDVVAVDSQTADGTVLRVAITATSEDPTSIDLAELGTLLAEHGFRRTDLWRPVGDGCVSRAERS